MPTSMISQVALVNIGPLTTTWTAPSACATITHPPYLAQSYAAAAGIPFWAEDCASLTDDPFNECVPSATKMNEEWASRKDNPMIDDVVYYHSPGNICPSNWTTVGVAARGNGTSYSLSGIYADPTFTLIQSDSTTTHIVTQSGARPGIQPAANMFMSAIEPLETAVACCPSGFTAKALGLGCFSYIPRELYTATTGCHWILDNDVYTLIDNTYTYHGRTVSGQFPSATASTMTRHIEVETIEPDESSSFIGIAVTAGVTLA
ncbi:hypothetical protein CGCSCA4_v008648 [Colletotrichum siamense]|uniref:Uncharacterized protein n=1 Tax=Colletotrichum siamense TaxID=690259 RepID=A0A9P5ERE4_COLSI|nr:hypothetical protein CGCSCA4_v008648 [Colletotrichum siamense]KAF4858440.1 hypothetical protein CGCSCA2_v007229 [Colletotrichum siamense]